MANPNAKLPELPEGYSWWVDEYDLRILQNGAEEDYWSYYSRVNRFEDQPDCDGRFYTATEDIREVEYTRHDFMLFFKRKATRSVSGSMISNIRWTVVSRLEYYDSRFLEERYMSGAETNALWERIRADGLNTTDNIEGRARALKIRFDAIQENKELVGHYPPKTMGKTA